MLTNVQVTAESTTEIEVSFPPKPSDSPVTLYIARIKDGSQNCTVSPTASPRTCVIPGLEPGTQYRVVATAAIFLVESDPYEQVGFTLPDGELIRNTGTGSHR